MTHKSIKARALPTALVRIVQAFALIIVGAPVTAQVTGQTSSGSSTSTTINSSRPSLERRPMLEFDRQFQSSPRRQQLAYQWAADFARCSTNIGRRSVVTLLAQSPGSASEMQAARRLTQILRTCATGVYPVSIVALRGAMAEELVRRRGPILTGKVSQTLDAVRYRAFENAVPAPVNSRDKATAELNRIARCQVLFATGLSRDLLAQKIGSNAETAMLDKIYASAPVCGAPTSKVMHWIQRAAIAEALYHWLKTEPKPTESAALRKMLVHG